MYSPGTMHTWWQASMINGPQQPTFPIKITLPLSDAPPIQQHTGFQQINARGGGLTIQEGTPPYAAPTVFPNWTAITARPQCRYNDYNVRGNPGGLLGGVVPIHSPTQKISAVYPQQVFY